MRGDPLVRLGPRLVIAGTHSGVGKTTVATGLMAALRHRGVRVRSAKVGPDFIDPGYHSIATGQPGRNLDPWLSGMPLIGALAGRAARGGDLLVIEGVMGLFDGAADGSSSTTADVAAALDAPIILVVDASAMAGSIAALVHGYATHDHRLRIAGVILNRVASDGHEAMLRRALEDTSTAVLGVMRRDDQLVWRERHLGLVPVVENRRAVRQSLGALSVVVAASCNLELIESIARQASERYVESVPMPRCVGQARIAIAGGSAFSFTYEDNIEALMAAGADLIPFDPLVDLQLPECEGMIVGGGFPEIKAAELSANLPLFEDVRRRAHSGMTIWAECGGLLWLCRSLDGHPMVGVVGADATMTEKLTIGYRTATTTTRTPIGAAGTCLKAHEFHYSTIEPHGSALQLEAFNETALAGFGGSTLLASYLHIHLGGSPKVAEALVRTAGTTTNPS